MAIHFILFKEYLARIGKQKDLASLIPCVAMLLVAAAGLTVTPAAGAAATGTGAAGAVATNAAPATHTTLESEPAASASGEHQIVKVTISTSRTEVTSEGGYGIFADLQNMDTVPLTLRAAETMLVIQPELGDDHRRIIAVDGFYPTEERPEDADKTGVREIVLQPTEHYVAFWDVLSQRSGAAESTQPLFWLNAVRDYLIDRFAFVPGNYAFVVVGKTYRNVNGVPETSYHTYTDQVKLHVSLTQIDAMLAAALGGILGYIVTALREGGDFSKYTFIGAHRPSARGDTESALGNFKAWLIVGRNMFSAALISAVVTILLSRISDTQFPIKVSVADFWGALTVGFVAYFVGNKLIDKIVGFTAKGNGGGGGGRGAGGGGAGRPGDATVQVVVAPRPTSVASFDEEESHGEQS